jgi:hypothetical protein
MNENIPRPVRKYLEKYSYRRWILEADKKDKISAAVIIPAIKEYENIKRLLQSLSDNDSDCLEHSLILFVINNFVSSEAGVKEENIKTINYIRSIMNNKVNIGLIDASSAGMEMPEKVGGVGLARKVGMDLALTAFDYSGERKKFLVSLDADCTVEKNYFSELFKYFNGSHAGAAVIKYRHDLSGDSEQTAAIVCYEIFLRYYVLGLRYSDSPYSFHTIGSAFACDYETYIKAEGMNKRKAAEDFYFLQKTAKNAGVGRINSTTVFPASRASWRVPFGTGMKVSQFKSDEESYLLYNPAAFRILKEWLSFFNGSEILDAGHYLRSAKNISRGLFDFLIQQNFKKDFGNILNNSTTVTQLSRQKFSWFDGFRTLKLIHYLRDNEYPMINMFEALDTFLDWINFKDKPIYAKQVIPPLDIQKEYLEILRNLDEKI